MKAILTCKCNDTPQYAKDAYSIIYKTDNIPEVFSGSDSIYRFIDKLDKDDPLTDYAKSMAKNRNKFAFLVEYGDEPLNVVDLLNNRRVA